MNTHMGHPTALHWHQRQKMLKGGLLSYSLGENKPTKEAKTVRNRVSKKHLFGYGKRN